VACETDLSSKISVAEPDSDTDGASVVDTDVEEEDTDVEEDPGPSPEIEVTPTEILFGTWVPECESDPFSFFIKNLGEADLDVSSIELRGVGQLAFAADTTSVTLAPLETKEVQLVFTPERIATYEPFLNVNSNDPDEPTVRVDLSGNGAFAGEHVDVFFQEPADAVDVLWSIDYSGSMSSDIQALGQSFDTFINQFVALGLDFHIAVITADPDCPEFQGPVITPQTPDPVGEFIRQTSLGGCSGEAAFGASMNALDPAMLATTNTNFLRTDANLAVVAISDEPEQTEGGGGGLFGINRLSVSAYVNFLNGVKAGNPGKVSFSGIVAPRNTSIFGGIFGGCDIVQAAPRYHDAIQRTGGVFGNLCQLDLDPFLTHLAFVAAGIDSRFPLSKDPRTSQPITVTVGGVTIAENGTNGYTYDAATNEIILHGNAVPDAGEPIEVIYTADASCDE
jgi:hypothetical protein